MILLGEKEIDGDVDGGVDGDEEVGHVHQNGQGRRGVDGEARHLEEETEQFDVSRFIKDACFRRLNSFNSVPCGANEKRVFT